MKKISAKKNKEIDKMIMEEIAFAEVLREQLFAKFSSYQQRASVLGSLISQAYEIESELGYEEGKIEAATCP